MGLGGDRSGRRWMGWGGGDGSGEVMVLLLAFSAELF